MTFDRCHVGRSSFAGAQLHSAMGLVALYIVLRFVAIDFLPDKWFNDVGRLTDIMQSGSFEDGSFGATAYLLSLLPIWVWTIVNLVLATILVVAACRAARTTCALAVTACTLPLMMLLTLIVPSKETFVVAMSLVALAVSRRYPPATLLAVIATLYAAYGACVRSYYLLILAVWLGLLALPRSPKPFLPVLASLGVIALLLLPTEIFHALQDQRDTSNTYALYINYSDNRTAFFNPFPPDDAWSFLRNYAYAAVVLNFPFIKWATIKELILFTNIVLYARLVGAGLRSPLRNDQMLATLFISHVVVLWLFEPDLGSYVRHFSSVIAYLIPALGYVSRNGASPARQGRVPHPDRQRHD